ncbi:MAG TPA: hypothetical protein VKT28_22780 [Puia sp.]|nr:hypothetical protein [Puia sp.]
MEENAQEPLINLNVDYDAGNILKETARWTRFISIIGIIGVAIVLLVLIFAGAAITAMYARMMPGVEAMAGVILFIAFLVIAIAGFMVFLLYRFSTLVRKGIDTQDQQMFNSGLSALKIYFIISGVFAILSLLINSLSLFKL